MPEELAHINYSVFGSLLLDACDEEINVVDDARLTTSPTTDGDPGRSEADLEKRALGLHDHGSGIGFHDHGSVIERTSVVRDTSPVEITVSDDQAEEPRIDEATRELLLALFGARVVASDGRFLGIVSAKDDCDSIAHASGVFGSPYSPCSILNDSIDYGGPNGAYSPFNIECTIPPEILKEDRILGVLTSNTSIQNRFDPEVLLQFLRHYSKDNTTEGIRSMGASA